MRKKLLIAATSRFSCRSNLKPLSFEVSDSVGLSHVQWRGWSYAAASVPSEPDTPNGQKGRKKIPKHKRRAMVESYVNKYRTTNAGKFPTVTEVKKHVGGHYYIVREILQELEYKSKMNYSNSMGESKHPITVAAKVSSRNSGNVKDRLIQDDSQSVVSGDRETIINAGYEDVEEERGSLISSGERRLSKDIEISSTPGNHCIAYESNRLDKCSDKPYPSSIHMQNDVTTEEAVSSYSDSVAPERHLLKEETEHVSTSFIEKSGSSHSKAQSNDSKFVDENNPIFEVKASEKAEYQRKDQDALEDLPGVDGPNHKMEQSQGSLELDESKINSSNNRETSGAVVSEKSTFWGNLKSFADGIINIWRKL